MTRLTIQVRRRGDEHRVLLNGELDNTTAPLLQDQLDALTVVPEDTIAIDLRGLRSMDSGGLRSILRSQEHAQNLGCRFLLIRGSAAIQRIFAPVALENQLQFIDGDGAPADRTTQRFGCDLSAVVSSRRALPRLTPA